MESSKAIQGALKRAEERPSNDLSMEACQARQESTIGWEDTTDSWMNVGWDDTCCEDTWKIEKYLRTREFSRVLYLFLG